MNFDEKYDSIWENFSSKMLDFYQELSEAVKEESESSLHSLLANTYWLPYKIFHDLMEFPSIDSPVKNIGSATGFFFEQLVISLVVPFIQYRLPCCRFARNSTLSPVVENIARDPDLHIMCQDKNAVLEIKVAPKKRDLEWLYMMRQSYEEAGIHYFVIGGYAQVNSHMLSELIGENWISFLAGSDRNKPLLSKLTPIDKVLTTATNYLTST